MRFFVSPYEASMYKYLKEVDPDAAQEDPEDPFMQVASRKGDIHEEKLFNDLRDEVDTSIVIVNSDPEDMFAATREAMRNGIDLIYQGALKDDTFFGRADFLFKVERVATSDFLFFEKSLIISLTSSLSTKSVLFKTIISSFFKRSLL